MVKQPKLTAKSSAYGKIGKLLRSLSDNEDEDNGPNTATMVVSGDAQQPWLEDFHGYLQSKDHLPATMAIIQWWGTNTDRYPVWASLGWDYLSVMATSISSDMHFCLPVSPLASTVITSILILSKCYNASSV